MPSTIPASQSVHAPSASVENEKNATENEIDVPRASDDLDSLLEAHKTVDPETGKVEFRTDFLFISDQEQVWNTSVVLLKHFEELEKTGKFSLRGKTVLEIGSGLGHLAFTLHSKFGAQVVCTEHPKRHPLLQVLID